MPQRASKLLVFISHDSRDHAIAEAFAILLRKATGNLINSFRSSDRTGKDGIPYGVSSYDEIERTLDDASDVVCLLTPRSYERPWIHYEAGYAIGRFHKRVHGLLLGVTREQVASSGALGRLQNCTDDPHAIAGLVRQLAGRVPRYEPADELIQEQVEHFLRAVAANTPVPPFEDPRRPRFVHHVSLPVRNLAESVKFYGTSMGFKRRRRPRLGFVVRGAWFELPDGQQLHLIENPNGTFRTSDNVDYNDCHFAVRVPDLSAAYIRLSKHHTTDMNKDIAFRRYPHFYVLDPDKHVIEVNADRVSDRTLFLRGTATL